MSLCFEVQLLPGVLGGAETWNLNVFKVRRNLVGFLFLYNLFPHI